MTTTARFQSLRSWDDDESPTHPSPRFMLSKPTPIVTTRRGFESYPLQSFEEIVAVSPNRRISTQDAPKGPRALSFRRSFGDYGDTDGEFRGKQDRILNNSVRDPSHVAAAKWHSRTDSVASSSTGDKSALLGSPQSINFVPFSPYKDSPSPGMGQGGIGPSPPVSPPWYRDSVIPGRKRAKRHPFSESFEPPRWRIILIHVLMCIVAYPLLTITAVVATKGKTLFWTRLIVGLGCGIVGFALGLSLLALARAFLEAASKRLGVPWIFNFDTLFFSRKKPGRRWFISRALNMHPESR